MMTTTPAMPLMELTPAERWTLGLGLALSNCVLSSIGFTMQRKAHLLDSLDAENEPDHPMNSDGSELGDVEDSPRESRACCEQVRPLWLLGVLIYIFAAVPDVLAYTLIPQLVCSTVACLRLVLVSCLAHFALDEKVSGRECLGMAICCLGTFLCLWFGPHPDQHKVAEPSELYHPKAATYLLVGGVLLLTLLLVEHFCWEWSSAGAGHARLVLPATTALTFGLEKVFNTEVGCIRKPDTLLEDPKWIVMVVAIAVLGLLDFYLNLRGAKRMPIQVFVPVTFAFGTVIQYFQAIAIFDEFDEMSAWRIGLSLLGALASLAGALCIQPPDLSLLDKQVLMAECPTVSQRLDSCDSERDLAMSRREDINASQLISEDSHASQLISPADAFGSTAVAQALLLSRQGSYAPQFAEYTPDTKVRGGAPQVMLASYGNQHGHRY